MQGRIKQMINGKDQEIITINKTGNSILNNAKYSADNTDECLIQIFIFDFIQ